MLTVVMYHYVRDVEKTRFPEIHAISTEQFSRHVQHIQRVGHVVRMDDVVSAVDGAKLPNNSYLLTFDDGYADHYENVFPILRDAGVSGCFYPPAGAVEHRRMLNVNRIHFLLASVSTAYLASEIDRQVGNEAQAYRAKWMHPNRWDDAETIYVKRMLQVGLPLQERENLGRRLFADCVSDDEASFADDLYVSSEHLREMIDAGMHVGSHTVSHRWLDSLTPGEQWDELADSVDFLRRLGLAADGWTISYPFGGWNDTTIQFASQLGARVGLMVEARPCDLASDDPLLLPRIDANDV